MEQNRMFTRRMLLRLLLPLILEQFLVVAVGMADTVMVSAVGETAVSGVSLVDQINVLLIQAFTALATGGAVVVSQYIGKRDGEYARRTAKQLVCVSFLTALAICAATLLFHTKLLHAIYGNVEPDVMQNARVYLFITALGYPFLGLYNAGAALYRSMGNSKISLAISGMMNIINVCGNAVLIYGAKLGAAGAGISTLLSQAAAGILIIMLLHRKNNPLCLTDLLHPQWEKKILKSILLMGIPTGIENSIFQVGKLMVAGLITTFGTASIAANAICNNLGSLCNLAGAAIGLGMITVVGQCVGAGDYRQARAYTGKLCGLAYLCLAASCMAVLAAAPSLMGIFNVSQEASALALRITRMNCVITMLLWTLSFVLPNALRAAGDAKFTMAASMISMCVFRVGFSYLLGRHFGMGLAGIWIAMYIDWCVRILAFVLRFAGHKWEQIRVI